jgi:PAS domain S-box-containing protein
MNAPHPQHAQQRADPDDDAADFGDRRSQEDDRVRAAQDPQMLLEELRVHQVELELQAQALRASEEMAQGQARSYQHLLAEVPVALLRLDDHGRILSANRAAERLFGQSSIVLEGRYLFRQGASEEDRRAVLAAIQQGITQERFESHQHRFEFGGQVRVLDLHMSQVPDRSGGAAQWLMSLVDQTRVAQEHAQQQATLEELRQALSLNRDLALVADCTPSLVAVCDATERVLWVNPRFAEVAGWTVKQLQSVRLLDSLLKAETGISAPEREELRLRWSLASGVVRQRLPLQGVTGQRIWADVSLVSVRDEQGRVLRRIFIADDVSEQVRLQVDREEVLQQQAMHTVQSEFLSRMSHNMRTPLNAIMGFSQLLLLSSVGQAGEDERQKLRIVRDAGQQLLHMVDQALSLVRMDYQAHEFDMGPVDLSAAAADVVLLLADRAADKRITVTHDVAPGTMVHGNAQLIQEILSNLLSNAIKYSLDGQRVELGVRPANEGELALTVADSGIGIPADALGQLFKPFSRLANGRSMAPGHGLGLAISLQQAQLMGGRIEVSSQLGAGSVFSFILARDDAPAPEVPLPPGATELLGRAPPLTMVYVEDDVINQTLLAAAMQMCPQVDFHLAGSVSEGLGLIARLQPDVVLLDINLPDGSGVDMCRQLCADPATRPSLILALSADTLPEHVDEAARAGFDHYLTKPVEFDQLFAWMGRVQPRVRSAT